MPGLGPNSGLGKGLIMNTHKLLRQKWDHAHALARYFSAAIGCIASSAIAHPATAGSPEEMVLISFNLCWHGDPLRPDETSMWERFVGGLGQQFMMSPTTHPDGSVASTTMPHLATRQ